MAEVPNTECHFTVGTEFRPHILDVYLRKDQRVPRLQTVDDSSSDPQVCSIRLVPAHGLILHDRGGDLDT